MSNRYESKLQMCSIQITRASRCFQCMADRFRRPQEATALDYLNWHVGHLSRHQCGACHVVDALGQQRDDVILIGKLEHNKSPHWLKWLGPNTCSIHCKKWQKDSTKVPLVQGEFAVVSDTYSCGPSLKPSDFSTLVSLSFFKPNHILHILEIRIFSTKTFRVSSNFVMPNLARSGLKVMHVKDFSWRSNDLGGSRNPMKDSSQFKSYLSILGNSMSKQIEKCGWKIKS